MREDRPWRADAGTRPYVRERHEGLREAKHEDCLEVVTPPVRDLKSSGCTVCVVFTSALVERIALVCKDTSSRYARRGRVHLSIIY